MRIFDKFAQFMLQGRSRAIVAAAFLVFIPLVRLLGWAILGLVTLRKGMTEGVAVLGFITLGLVFMGVGALHYAPSSPAGQDLFLPVLLTLVGLFVSSLLVWIFAIILRRYLSWSKVLQVGLWGSVLLVTMLHLFQSDITALWLPLVKSSIQQMQQQLTHMQLPSLDVLLAKVSKIMTGIQILMALLASLFSLLIARWWQASLFNPGGLRRELLQIRLGLPEAGLLGIALLLYFIDISATGRAIVIDSAPVIAVIFFLAGLALVHRFIEVAKKPWLGVVVFYGLFLVVDLRYMVCLLVSLAFIDSMVNVSHRLIKR